MKITKRLAPYLVYSQTHPLIGAVKRVLKRLVGHPSTLFSQPPCVAASQRHGLSSALQRLASNQQGAVAITFAIVSLLSLAIFLFSLDLTRHNAAQTRLWNALDSAVLSAGRKMEGFSANAEQQDPGEAWKDDAAAYFYANMPSNYMGSKITDGYPTITYDQPEGSLVQRASMEAKGRLPLFTTGYISQSAFPLYASNAAERRSLGGDNYQDSFKIRCTNPSPEDCYDYNLDPFQTRPDGLKLYLHAFTDDVTYDGSTGYRDMYHFGYKLWGDISLGDKTYPLATPGVQGLTGIDKRAMPRIFPDRIGALVSGGASDTNWTNDMLIRNMPGDSIYPHTSLGDGRWGEKLVLSFMEASNQFPADNAQVSFPIIDLNPGGEVRVAVFHDGAPSNPTVHIFKKNDLIDGRVNITNDAAGKAISRLVIGVEKEGDSFAIGTDISLGQGIQNELRLVK